LFSLHAARLVGDLVLLRQLTANLIQTAVRQNVDAGLLVREWTHGLGGRTRRADVTNSGEHAQDGQLAV
jgi:hypothetical protein